MPKGKRAEYDYRTQDGKDYHVEIVSGGAGSHSARITTQDPLTGISLRASLAEIKLLEPKSQFPDASLEELAENIPSESARVMIGRLRRRWQVDSEHPDLVGNERVETSLLAEIARRSGFYNEELRADIQRRRSNLLPGIDNKNFPPEQRARRKSRRIADRRPS